MSANTNEKVRMRRVQRLGTSSLVVTLPKEWVRKVNLKPGDVVYVVVEGGSVRIIPYNKRGEAIHIMNIDVSKLPKGLSVSRLVSCAYVTRVDVLRLENISWEAALEVRSMASKFMGVDVVSGPEYVEVRCILDDDKVSMKDLLENIARLGLDLLGLVERLLTEPNQTLINLTREAINEIVKYEHLVVRRMSATPASTLGQPDAAMLYAAGLLGSFAATLWHLANYLATLAETKGRPEVDPKKLNDLIKGVQGLLSEILRWKPEDLELAARLADDAGKLRLQAWQKMLTAENPHEAVAYTMLYNALRELDIAVNALTCATVISNAPKLGKTPTTEIKTSTEQEQG
ncbi:SpoVT/AbrB domain-containing protein [Pyrolobus fumarii 1A]|uniref:SpoVT/AbrB domain-containing protein n=1 Tax=Pyrolobus fumarii (strain DSM 11204 / 1A) TaxID=694429 RepID=G0ED45_PYRF1|nr:AbrB/MazE/SpoVT family DNA-binding domain-containing protein [Pyrolobus fumarii]AEM39723.1 SpoVT/AbrB domain-containing protein [Pyrolobus fumarii 1A]